MRKIFSVLLCSLWLSVGGCITDATLELSMAPFDATTDIANGVTAASSEFTQPLREFTSSTTPGSWFTGNNPAKSRQKVEVFTAYSLENLRSDIARGQGEYLVSLSTLAGVPDERRGDFQVQLKNSYATIFDEMISPRESVVRVVEVAWAAGMGGMRH